MPVTVVYQQYNLCICTEPQVPCPGIHLKYTFNGMLRFSQENTAAGVEIMLSHWT